MAAKGTSVGCVFGKKVTPPTSQVSAGSLLSMEKKSGDQTLQKKTGYLHSVTKQPSPVPTAAFLESDTHSR